MHNAELWDGGPCLLGIVVNWRQLKVNCLEKDQYLIEDEHLLNKKNLNL